MLCETHTEEVIAIINSLIKSESTRQDDIPKHMLKLCKNVLSPLLEQIFNLCIKESKYPQIMKCAEVFPIH